MPPNPFSIFKSSRPSSHSTPPPDAGQQQTTEPRRGSVRSSSHPLKSRAAAEPVGSMEHHKSTGIKKVLKKIKPGRKAGSAQVAMVGTSSATQGPKDGKRVAKLGDIGEPTAVEVGRSEVPKLDAEKRQRRYAIEQTTHTEAPARSSLQKLKKFSQHAIAATGLHRGGKPGHAELTELFQPARKTGVGGNDVDRTAPRTKELAQAVMKLLNTKAAHERADTLHELTSTWTVEGGGKLEAMLSREYRGEIDAARARVQDEVEAATGGIRNALIGEALGVPEDSPHHEPIKAALRELLDRVGGGSNALSGQLVATTARRLFRDSPEKAEQALRGLLESTVSDLTGKAAAAVRETRPTSDPALQLATELANQPGGGKRLMRLIRGAGASEKHKAATAVALAALHARDAAGREGRLTQAQLTWLGNAADHAAQEAGVPGHTPADDDARTRRIAYRGVQNGFMTNEPGSRYARINERLPNIGNRWLDQAKARNERAAGGRLGRLANSVSAALPNRLGGASPSPVRKSALRSTVRAAARNGMLPPRKDALRALGNSATRMTEMLGRARSEQPPAAGSRDDVAQRLMLAVLAAVAPQEHAPDKNGVKNLKESFFQAVEGALGGHSIDVLGGGFAQEWAALRSSRPNAGHVLALVAEQLDLRAIAQRTDPSPLRLSLAERGQRSEDVALGAIARFRTLADVSKTSVHALPEGEARTQAAALVTFATELGVALNKVNPKAALATVRADTFTDLRAVALGDAAKAALPPELQARWQTVGDVVADLPEGVRTKWEAIAPTNPDAGKVMGIVHEALPALLGDGLKRSAEFAETGAALRDVRRDVHINRFERAIADTITSFADVRRPRDVAALIESTSQRVSLGEKIKSSDGRSTGADAGKYIGIHFAVPDAVFTPILAYAHSAERSLDTNMNGAALQTFIGETSGHAGAVGFKAGIRRDIGNEDRQFNVSTDGGGDVGIAMRIEAKMEAGFEKLNMNGIALRMKRAGGHEDVLRRNLGAALSDIANPRPQPPGEADYPDTLSMLLDRHPHLILAEVDQDKYATKGELSAGVTAQVRFSGTDDDEAVRRTVRNAAALGANIGAASKTQRGSSATHETRGALSIDEFKVNAQHRVEIGASLSTPVTLDNPHNRNVITEEPDANAKDHTVVARAPGASVGGSLQLYNDGDELTLRVTTSEGAIWADQTQRISEHESIESFIDRIGDNYPQMLKLLAARDKTAGRSGGDKLNVALDRREDLLRQMLKAEGPDTVFSVVDKLRPEAAEAWDALLALAQEAEARGAGDEEVNAHYDALRALAFNWDSWTPSNVQTKTKAKSEQSSGFPTPFRSAKAGGESNRLHEFYPATAQNVGRHENMPIRPLELWSGRLETIPEGVLEDTGEDEEASGEESPRSSTAGETPRKESSSDFQRRMQDSGQSFGQRLDERGRAFGERLQQDAGGSGQALIDRLDTRGREVGERLQQHAGGSGQALLDRLDTRGREFGERLRQGAGGSGQALLDRMDTRGRAFEERLRQRTETASPPPKADSGKRQDGAKPPPVRTAPPPQRRPSLKEIVESHVRKPSITPAIDPLRRQELDEALDKALGPHETPRQRSRSAETVPPRQPLQSRPSFAQVRERIAQAQGQQGRPPRATLPPIDVGPLGRAMSMMRAASGGPGSEMVAELGDVAAQVGVAPDTLARYLTEHGELRDTPEVAAWLAALPPTQRFALTSRDR